MQVELPIIVHLKLLFMDKFRASPKVYRIARTNRSLVLKQAL
jgi:hypothetical protein